MKEQELREMREECKKRNAKDCKSCIIDVQCIFSNHFVFKRPKHWTDADIKALAEE